MPLQADIHCDQDILSVLRVHSKIENRWKRKNSRIGTNTERKVILNIFTKIARHNFGFLLHHPKTDNLPEQAPSSRAKSPLVERANQFLKVSLFIAFLLFTVQVFTFPSFLVHLRQNSFLMSIISSPTCQFFFQLAKTA